MIGHDSSLLNMVGHSAGALVFGIFLFLLTRDRAGARLPGSRLTMAAAALAFAWNAGALVLNGISSKPSPASSALELLSYSCLSLLAPVLLHLSLNRTGVLAIAGYATGAAAVCLHVAEVVLGKPGLHLSALGVIAVGLGAVTLASAVHLIRSAKRDRKSIAGRVLGAACLFVFMATYVHLGLEHGAPTWSNELLLHHASVPLALLIILHNHRFVLLDALIRFCANAALAGVFTFLGFRLMEAQARQGGPAGIPGQALLILGVCLLLLSFAIAREHLQRLLTHVVFGRGDASAVCTELRTGAEDLKTEADYLPWAMDRVAAFMRAERVRDIPAEVGARLRSADVGGPVLSAHLPELRRTLEELSAEVVVPLWLSATEAGFLLLGRRRGGQPYMSEDLRHLAQFASVIVDRVQSSRESELQLLADRAELRALQAQINPHFLFNALNAIYGLVPKQAAEARQTVLNLADLFRYFLRNDDTTIPLAEELRIIEAYLQIESLRLGKKLRQEIEVDPEALRVPIPKLSVQPLVENAVKHGIAPKSAGGLVRLQATMSAEGLSIRVEDSGGGRSGESGLDTEGAGVGLQNVARRLRLCYGAQAKLDISGGAGGTCVSFVIPTVKAAGVLR